MSSCSIRYDSDFADWLEELQTSVSVIDNRFQEGMKRIRCLGKVGLCWVRVG